MNMIGITVYYPAENATVPTRTECIKLQMPDSKIEAVHELVVNGVYCVDGSNDASNILPIHKLFTGSEDVNTTDTRIQVDA